jgi:lysozyme family protein
MENVDKAIEFTLSKEGGYVNDPVDPGGETNWGISKREFPELNIKTLTKAQAIEIYKRVYWVANILDSLPWPYSAAAFDTYVQHSDDAARKMIMEAYDDVRKLLEARRVYYLDLIKRNPAFSKYKKGWMARLNDLAKFCTIEKNLTT